LFVALLPILIFIQKNKMGYIRNVFSVLLGFKSWVGYGNEMNDLLPKLKPSVLSPADAIKNININNETRSRLHLAYSKDYRVENDLNIVWKSLNKLGN